MDLEDQFLLTRILDEMCDYFIDNNLINKVESNPFQKAKNNRFMNMYTFHSENKIEFKLQWGTELEKEVTRYFSCLSAGIIFFKKYYLV